jgi:hypothetical protein
MNIQAVIDGNEVAHWFLQGFKLPELAIMYNTTEHDIELTLALWQDIRETVDNN